MKPRSARRLKTKGTPVLTKYFRALHAHFGPQHWWPARTRLEVVLGAILAQNTAWRNVELALGDLRREGFLHLDRLRGLTVDELASRIRSAGFFRQKAATIRRFLDWLDHARGGSLSKLFSTSPHELRSSLLAIKGLGPETVDAILLYAGKQPFFVADAYTRRVLARHRLIPGWAGYSNAQAYLHATLKRDYLFYNEYHALIVEVGKKFCVKSAPKCSKCPLARFLPPAGPAKGGIS